MIEFTKENIARLKEEFKVCKTCDGAGYQTNIIVDLVHCKTCHGFPEGLRANNSINRSSLIRAAIAEIEMLQSKLELKLENKL